MLPNLQVLLTTILLDTDTSDSDTGKIGNSCDSDSSRLTKLCKTMSMTSVDS